jgi:RNase P subunit RPR2
MAKRATCDRCGEPTPPPELNTVYRYEGTKPVRTTVLRVCSSCFGKAIRATPHT